MTIGNFYEKDKMIKYELNQTMRLLISNFLIKMMITNMFVIAQYKFDRYKKYFA